MSVWILCLQLDLMHFWLQVFSPVHLCFSSIYIYKTQHFYLFSSSKMIFSIRGELMCWSVLFPRESEQIVPVHQMIWTGFFSSSHNRFYWLEPLAPQIQTPRKLSTKNIDHCRTAVRCSHRCVPPAALVLSVLCVIRLIQACRQKLKCSTGEERRDGRRGED